MQQRKDAIMHGRKSRYPSADPFLLWSTLAFKTGEMLMASAQVISHRTGRIALAGANPGARDRREFTRMGQEKIEAATESAVAIALRTMTLNQQLGILAFTQFAGIASRMMALAAGGTPSRSGKRQSDFVHATLANSSATAFRLSDSIAHLVHHGLKPIHSRATGNARRLLKSG
jgi:hypothetical protein